MIFNSNNCSEDNDDRERRRIDRQAADWVAKLDNDPANEEEKLRFQAWLTRNPAHQRAYDELQRFWSDPRLTQTLTTFPLSPKSAKRPRYFANVFRLAVPAAAVGLFSAVFFYKLISVVSSPIFAPAPEKSKRSRLATAAP
ncbi:MAG: FecR/PupR family sigma factor regulator [Methylococcaceae bacterium]|nr:FecR/PupR family sigma factor regulator [Methylococcaceae bacterium]